MKKIKLALGTHNHQPVGNFEFVFEDAYKKSYLPFLEKLEGHPKIKIAQHYTGILFEWILHHYPDFVRRLKALVAAGQVEMMTGGFYEPILINIPDNDKIGQIKKLTRFVEKHTGYNPSGMWLAERIWEPQLPTALAAANIKYTLVDDSHFKSAGLDEDDLHGYYVTEDNGNTVKIFPISEKLRYTIPFQDPQVTIDYLKSLATEEGDKIVIFADDGEKFGIWPGTYQHCYENGWIERFFQALETNLDWIELVHFSEVIENLKPMGNIYLPTASYREMMEWALPAKAIHKYEAFEHQLKDHKLFDQNKVFVRGGFWRNFLAKYQESNNLHKKSLYVSNKISRLEKEGIDTTLLSEAKDHLWAGQCNCPYWHGVFGGLYLNNIRFAVYRNMIQAETILDKLTRDGSDQNEGWVRTDYSDFDGNGLDELIVETPVYNLYFAPSSGGTLFEMDFKPRTINLLDTMTRREEGYHRKLVEHNNSDNNNKNNDAVASIHDMVIAKEADLDKYLHYDSYRRSALVDHFLAPETTIDDFKTGKYNELGDFIHGAYQSETKKRNGKLNIMLSRQGRVHTENGDVSLLLRKELCVSTTGSDLEITYSIQNLEKHTADLWFGFELNYALLAGDAPDRYYYAAGQEIDNKRLNSTGILNHVHEMGLKDEWLDLDIHLLLPDQSTVWRLPIETVSQSESGFERVYQSSVILPNWKIKLSPGGEWKAKIVQKINGIVKNVSE
ncbi:DUF1926 domain-containing protein [candidate division KSB1 bacterium]|nr:DUF1926 domain-containing protein [candidate division KSB1 bacterium]